jgi:hypothetical protein
MEVIYELWMKLELLVLRIGQGKIYQNLLDFGKINILLNKILFL